VRKRKWLVDHGLDAGAETIAAHLAREGITAVPAVSTIWRILRRRGFVVPEPHKRPRSSWIRFAAEQPNERWQADTTDWQLADGAEVEILNIEDDHSRLDIDSRARVRFEAADVVTCVRVAFRRHGLPAQVLTDNGAIFTGGPRGGGRVALEVELATHGILANRSTPYHPQTCGKVERFHQTQKKWLAKQPPAATLTELQRQLDRFRRYYNTTRPHRALHRRTPGQAYAARPKAIPTGPRIDPHDRVRHDTVDAGGTITLRHDSRLHHIGLGREHAGKHVLALVHDRDVRVIDRDVRVIDRDTGRLLRALHLDPARDYQPLGRPPGPRPATSRTAPPAAASRLAAGHPQGTGLDPGEDGATLSRGPRHGYQNSPKTRTMSRDRCEPCPATSQCAPGRIRTYAPASGGRCSIP
jgi:transposase InsO family protein